MSTHNGNTNGADKKKIWQCFNINTVITLVGWIAAFSYYIGVHKANMADLQKNFESLRDGYKILQTQLTKIDSEGGLVFQRFEKKVENLETKVNALESSKDNLNQQNQTIDKNITSLDSRMVKIEDAIPKIALLNQSVDSVKEAQREMREDVKKIPQIQVQLAELKTLMERSLQANSK